jgi:branched-chain amino acid transport system substrate-binding protein
VQCDAQLHCAGRSGRAPRARNAGTVYTAELASQDFGGAVAGRKIEIIHADHQNKPDIASAIARKWFDAEGVDVILNLTSIPVALAVQEIARERHRITLITGSSSSELTGKACSPYSTQWLEDTYTLSAGIVNGVFNPEHRKWFFIAVSQARVLSLTCHAGAWYLFAVAERTFRRGR